MPTAIDLAQAILQGRQLKAERRAYQLAQIKKRIAEGDLSNADIARSVGCSEYVVAQVKRGGVMNRGKWRPLE